MKNNNRTIAIVAGIVIGLVILCCIGAVIITSLGGVLLGSSSSDIPQGVNISVSAPTEVTQGEIFFITVRIENTASSAQTLDSIDIGLDYLEGVVINSATPAYFESYDIILWRSFTFLETLPAGETTTVTIEATALNTGDYSGELDVCINDANNCITNTIRTQIVP